MFQTLKDKINERDAVIGIIGLGYVGLPLLKSVLSAGYKAVGFDIDEDKICKLVSGKSYLEHISIDSIHSSIESGKCEATTDFSKAQFCDVLVLCVPTPLSAHREPDLSYVLSSVRSLSSYFRKGQALSFESTTYPGTTEELILPIIEDQSLAVGEDFFLIYSPEREDPGNKKFGLEDIPKVLGGHSHQCAEVGECFYRSIVGRTVVVSSLKCAEMTKILENTYRSVNIALVNELKIVADAMDIDIFEVIQAAATKPFGFQPFYPGPGLGGHCIPIDPFYLTWKAREYGLNTRFIELAGEVNSAMPSYVIEKLSLALNERKKPINGSNILVLGVAYKKNIGDVRESPGVEIIHQLELLGADVSYHDQFVLKIPKMRKYSLELSSVPLTEKNIQAADACLLITDHDSTDYEILKGADLIVDTRGRLAKDLYPNAVSA